MEDHVNSALTKDITDFFSDVAGSSLAGSPDYVTALENRYSKALDLLARALHDNTSDHVPATRHRRSIRRVSAWAIVVTALVVGPVIIAIVTGV